MRKGFSSLHIYLRAPLERMVMAGRAQFGTVHRALTDADIEAVPREYRADLARFVRASVEWDDPDGEPPALELDKPDEDIETIIAALRREHADARAAAAKTWLDQPDESWLDKGWDDDWLFGDPIVEEVLALADVPAVAVRIEQLKKDVNERSKKRAEAHAGLREYALSLPEYRRGAEDGYDVVGAALDAFARTIAAFDEDAFVFRIDQEEFKRSQLQDRKAPEQHAFNILDAVTEHIKNLRAPTSVGVRVGRIQRFKQAVREGNKWKSSVPVTVVPVWIEPYVVPGRVVLFFADAEEKQRYVNERSESENIPF